MVSLLKHYPFHPDIGTLKQTDITAPAPVITLPFAAVIDDVVEVCIPKLTVFPAVDKTVNPLK